MTRIIYYTTSQGENPVREFIESLGKKQKAKIFRIFQYIEVYGLFSILPHLKKLSGTDLWEIRILGQDNIRVLYVSLSVKSIVVLHGFIKKTQKTPDKEIVIALKRLTQYKNSFTLDK